MPVLQELSVHQPDMMHTHFYLLKESNFYQKWERPLYNGDVVAFYGEDTHVWMEGKVDCIYIFDGSGNAPQAHAHFFLLTSYQGKQYRYELCDGLSVRFVAPTDQELVEASIWCEGGDWTVTYNTPAQWVPCSKHGARYVTEHGKAVWYCDGHKPAWAHTA